MQRQQSVLQSPQRVQSAQPLVEARGDRAAVAPVVGVSINDRTGQRFDFVKTPQTKERTTLVDHVAQSSRGHALQTSTGGAVASGAGPARRRRNFAAWPEPFNTNQLPGSRL
jgi:hypothetical protein